MAPAIRPATLEDAAGISAIYDDVIATTTAVFSDRRDTPEHRAAWIAQRSADGFPVLVADDGGTVAALGSYGPFRPFPGYRLTVEHSVHVHRDHRRRGLGRTMMEALIEHARGAGHHVMVAGVDAGNAGSLRLHASLGFVEVGRMPQVAAKFGRWLDLTFLQLQLDDRPAPPPPPAG